MISAFVIRCDGRDDENVKCKRKKVLRTRIVGERNLNAATKYLVHKMHWGVSWDDKGALHYCKQCNRRRLKEMERRRKEDEALRQQFLRKVQRKTERLRQEREEKEKRIARRKRKREKLQKLKKKKGRR